MCLLIAEETSINEATQFKSIQKSLTACNSSGEILPVYLRTELFTKCSIRTQDLSGTLASAHLEAFI